MLRAWGELTKVLVDFRWVASGPAPVPRSPRSAAPCSFHVRNVGAYRLRRSVLLACSNSALDRPVFLVNAAR